MNGESNQIKEIIHYRQEILNNLLISAEEIQELYHKIAEISRNYQYCDGCGLCCTVSVPLLKQEYLNIVQYLEHTAKKSFNSKTPKKKPSKKGTYDGHFTPQTLVCPFLAWDRELFDENLKHYGTPRMHVHPQACRIYEYRPLICRLHPNGMKCRQYSSYQAPNYYRLLKKDPHWFNLYNKFFYTMIWENIEHHLHNWDLGQKIMMIPGWYVRENRQGIQCNKEAGWFKRFEFSNWYLCDSFNLEPWEIEILKHTQQPITYASLIKKEKDIQEQKAIVELLTKLEYYFVIVPIDVMRQKWGTKGIQAKDWWDYGLDYGLDSRNQ
jgi:Fe-S-cluster containining protein